MIAKPLFIGTAGWSIASRHAGAFLETGTHLEKYASRLNAVEINSSFHRLHQRKTFERWAASVPDDFRFSVKIPRAITHERRLSDCDGLLDEFLEQVRGLGNKLSVLLVQLPPNLPFDLDTAELFLRALRQGTEASIACEPRHASWFTPDVERMLESLSIVRVAADPSRCQGGDMPGGWPKLAYFRMHGSPRIYYSDYELEALRNLKLEIESSRGTGAEVWCIFDNTARNHALGNALAVAAME